MKNILIFAGTTEGREVAQNLVEKKFSVTISVATEYGKFIADSNNPKIKILKGRLNKSQMENLILNFDAIVDATHPFAVEVSKNIFDACENVQKKYFRLLRSQSELEKFDKNDFYEFDSLTSLCQKIVEIEKKGENLGNIFISTGSKELLCFQNIENYQNRCFVRVLPTIDSIQKCLDAKFSPKNIIAMQGPFSTFINEAMFKETKSSILITKESGKLGGFDEKIIAAKKCKMKIFIVKRPKENCENSFEDRNELLKEILKI